MTEFVVKKMMYVWNAVNNEKRNIYLKIGILATYKSQKSAL